MNKKLAVMGLGLAVMTAWAATSYNVVTATGTTAIDVIVPGKEGGSYRAAGLAAVSDKAGSLLLLSTATELTLISTNWSTNLATTNIAVSVDALTKFASNDWVILQRANGTTYTNMVWGTNTVTNIGPVLIMRNTTGTNLAKNDKVFRMGLTNTFPVGAASIYFQGECFLQAPKGYPVRVQLDGTSACRVTAVTLAIE